MSDIAALVAKNLDVWTGALERKGGAGRGGGKRISLYGIDRLRALILDLAVRGKLVPQDAGDEPASELIARSTTALRAALARESFRVPAKIKPSTGADIRPAGWAATRLGALTRIINGRAFKKQELISSGTPVLRVGNLFTSKEWYYSDLILEDDKYIEDGDLIYAWSASFGPFIWSGGKVIYHYHIWKLEPYSENDISREFLRLFLQNETDAIKASGHGIAMLHMTKERMEQLSIDLPPRAEQNRIVAKVDELMALCDALEQESAEAMAAHQALVEILLATLVNSADAADLAHDWARLERHFDTLFTTEASIDALKQTILYLAVCGKLSRENDWSKNAEPLGNFAKLQNGYAFKSEWFAEDGIRLLRNINVAHGSLEWNDAVYLPKSMADIYERFQLSIDDVILTLDRPFIATGTKVATVAAADLPALLLQRVGRFQVGNKIRSDFIFLWVSSPLFSKQVDPGRSNGVPHISSKQVEAAKIFVPPLAEQRRIVAVVEALMALCNALKARLSDAAQTQRKLADVITERAAA